MKTTNLNLDLPIDTFAGRQAVREKPEYTVRQHLVAIAAGSLFSMAMTSFFLYQLVQH